MTAVELISKEEGFESKPYLDSLGIMTFGHGLTYITEDESKAIMQNRIYEVTTNLNDSFPWFRNLSDNRKIVIISMVYQLGFTGFSNFKKTIKAIEDEDWSKACSEMQNSKAYTQTKNRWDRQIALFYNG